MLNGVGKVGGERNKQTKEKKNKRINERMNDCEAELKKKYAKAP